MLKLQGFLKGMNGPDKGKITTLQEGDILAYDPKECHIAFIRPKAMSQYGFSGFFTSDDFHLYFEDLSENDFMYMAMLIGAAMGMAVEMNNDFPAYSMAFRFVK